MRSLIGMYNRNRKIIWFIIGLVVSVVALIHIMNNAIRQENLKFSTGKQNTKVDNYYETNYSVVSSEKIEEVDNKEMTSIIKDFIDNCNEGKVEEAYNLLSDDCKEVLYPTIQIFKTNYYDNNFYERKTYSLQLWNTKENKFIYKVELEEDMLTTGTTFNVVLRDYFTVIKEGENYKLSISGFIEKNDLNITKNIDSKIEVILESEEVFIDYLNLNMKVNNNTYKNMLLDTGKSGHTVYLKDSNGITYVSYLYEVNDLDLVIRQNSFRDFNIKFAKEFKENTKIIEVNFLDVILGYDKENSQNLSITVEME